MINQWRQVMWGSQNPVEITRLPNGSYRVRLEVATGYDANVTVALAKAYSHWRMMTGFNSTVLIAFQLKRAREEEKKKVYTTAICVGTALGILI